MIKVWAGALAAIFCLAALSGQVFAQDRVWVQIEAQPSLAEAQERIRDYSSSLDNLHGFALGSGWYGIVLGPYNSEDADLVLGRLRRQGLIPRDSFIAFGRNFQQQFWPIGGNAFTALAAPSPQITIDTIPQNPTLQIIDETPQQARASERLLTREDREVLQKALKWAGVYTAGIDGSFGRGTRNAMAEWQRLQGLEETGILTTAQRGQLLSDYNAVLEGLDLQAVTNTDAGIQIKLPLGVVVFDKYDPPLVHYTATTDLNVQISLISQSGDENSLLALYDLLQTLQIMPLTGPRNQERTSFQITGVDAKRHSYAYAELRGGVIKGFILVWPAGDERRRSRLQDELQSSFTPIDGVLNPSIVPPSADQAIDLIAGLQIRRPKLSRSGFYIDNAGTLITTTEVTDQCPRLTLDETYEARVIATAPQFGLAILQPTTDLAPAGFASFLGGIARIQQDIAVAGYSYEGALDAPTVTFGQIADIRGLNGDDALDRLSVSVLAGDVGGPVLDASGTVVGMLLPNLDDGRQLPQDVRFTVDAEAIKQVLAKANISYQIADASAPMRAEDLSTKAIELTALVSCWDN
ncbi:serine protease [Parasulfitobacter algicola]|uniref:Peptidoglycan-binding protein n=1 Tax=Parasulfitobacter algicola TaxID=2614809 RepID=A0ABX2IP88_9RHOB|nr:serine protease [Sulfitobacter algicola]NSX54709.1 peptidoglycan-binding protein [Sulfitobacter algicola]